MVFGLGKMFRKGVNWLGQKLGKVESFIPHARRFGKLVDGLGIGGGAVGRLIGQGEEMFKKGKKAFEQVQDFSEAAPEEQLKRATGAFEKYGKRFISGQSMFPGLRAMLSR